MAMPTTKPVRTYLDPDAVGPLPRAVIADDSDALAAARTMVRLPDAPTQELQADDLLEVVDPHRRPSSLAPVGFDTGAAFLPRRPLTKVVVATLAVAVTLIVVALVRSGSGPDDKPVAATAASPIAPPVTPAIAPTAAPSQPAEVTTGTLRVDPGLQGQHVYVDGVALSASAAMLKCGPHAVAVGSLARVRVVEVPCGGDVTVFR
jgi:hypothetical protein